MRRIAAVSGGSYQHHRTLHEPKYRRYFAEIIYLLDLPTRHLAAFDVLLLPDRLHRGLMRAACHRVQEFLASGGIVVAFGEQPENWLPGVVWEFRPTNFWWWLHPEARSGLVVRAARHSLFRYVTLRDCTWHYHGVFRPPSGAQTVIATEDGGAVFYVDPVTTPGTLVLTTLDPVYHFGSHFMPATERFLDGFLPWLAEEVELGFAGAQAEHSTHGMGEDG